MGDSFKCPHSARRHHKLHIPRAGLPCSPALVHSALHLAAKTIPGRRESSARQSCGCGKTSLPESAPGGGRSVFFLSDRNPLRWAFRPGIKVSRIFLLGIFCKKYPKKPGGGRANAAPLTPLRESHHCGFAEEL